ncbi:MAG: carbohydrate ABC transporter permease [Lachnospiraceae bacterium]|nr:carbohydrate ABC transporter permease [Lachnospiraceae bacterium]
MRGDQMTKKRARLLFIYVLLAGGAILCVMPMVYMLGISLKPSGALYEFPPHLFPGPEQLTLVNFEEILAQSKFFYNFCNSVIVACLTVVLSAFISSAFAFCLERFRFRGRKLLMVLVIGTMIIPGTTMIITQFQLANFLHLTNSDLGLVPFYVAWVMPFSTFMIMNYISSIPRDYDEAVYVEGGDVFTVFFRVIVPLSKPAIASVSIFNFLTSWDEFQWALTVIDEDAKRTMPIAIAGFFGEHQFTEWGSVFALSMISLIPVFVIFITMQKYFVSGLQAGGLKG